MARNRKRAESDLSFVELAKAIGNRPPAKNIAVGVTGKRHAGPVKDEIEHFMICPVCGQEIDMRNLAEVLHHDNPHHEPLKYPTSR
ncbi:hypothetical protein NKJ26_03060 [Mesorhizobium sp. M0152]|uniref:hypothetical protein n=1 Tax=Mesorhizobium sp. M0152 TaxID=2956898 RepID=UPI0033392B05